MVALRERCFVGGAWIFTVFSFGDVKGAMEVVDMLDADVEVECSEAELVEPETEGAGTCCGTIICHEGSENLDFTGKGAGLYMLSFSSSSLSLDGESRIKSDSSGHQ